MRAHVIANAALLVALLGGCRAPLTEGDFVLVSITVPAEVTMRYEGLRMAKFRGPGDRPTTKNQDASGNLLKVGVLRPEPGAELILRVQVYSLAEVLAEGKTLLTSDSSPITLRLSACTHPEPFLEEWRSCLDEPVVLADAGSLVVVSTDAAHEPTGRDGMERGDAGPYVPPAVAPPDAGDSARADAWTPPLCETPDFTVPLPALSVPPPAVPCAEYCGAMISNCPSVYPDDAHCLVACERVLRPPTGTGSDSLACRKLWADAATAAGEGHRRERCQWASPDSAGACGESCEVYCRMGALVCAPYFPDRTDCANACHNTVALIEEIMPGRGESEIYSSIKCRMEWLERSIFDPRLCSWAAPYNRCGPLERECPGLDFTAAAPPTSATFAPSPASPPVSPGTSFR